ncbi:DNA alkylation repair protein [Paenibacillus sp. FSL K6-1230]|uniref:DNA alkylation repair protein n=1 Tax=Paenibacillus sp. FSL K6-1230 TaxID=2921603 RepID=UPI0030FC6E7E
MVLDNKALIPEAIVHRKGARKAGDILPEVLEWLNYGRIESVNLTEWLAVDHIQLLKHVLNECGLHQRTHEVMSALEGIMGQSTMKMVPAIAGEWLGILREQSDQERAKLFVHLSTHRSDSVRCWAAYVVGLDQLELDYKLELIRPFAADLHFGVRELAWMAMRETISQQVKPAIHLLSNWVLEEDDNIRRFAVEATRPRGVWARHIVELKDNPAWGLPLLEPLKSDPSKYVQDSVANWLNDAAKTSPDWVAFVCDAWLKASDGKTTKRITMRAQRNLKC